MRVLFGLLCVCALGVMPVVGCGPAPECQSDEDCDDQNACTDDFCRGGGCWFEPIDCDDDEECTYDECDPDTGCSNVATPSGTYCGGRCTAWGPCPIFPFLRCCVSGIVGVCWDGECLYGPEEPPPPDCDGIDDCTGDTCPCTECGIRNAVAAGGGPYTFDCDGPQTVVTGPIPVDKDVSLDGEGNLTVDANQAFVVLLVGPDVTAELRGMTVTGGLWGGGIYNFGILTLTNSTVSGNGAEYGGGIYNDTDGILTLRNSTVSGNIAFVRGGGISNDGTLMLINSTVSGNTADTGGIGIDTHGDATLINSTVSGNIGRTGGTAVDGPARLNSSLIDGDCDDFYPVISGGYNIESPGNTCGFDTNKGDQVGITAEELNLGPLADNGGPTQTHVLLSGSVAIDVIPRSACEVDTDQRGEPRPELGGTLCDVGALEVIRRCESSADCDDRNDCTHDLCTDRKCEATPVKDGTTCANTGICQMESCVGGTYACTEHGILDAIRTGGGPHMFDCDGSRPVVTEAEIVILGDVILDGEGRLTVDADQTHRVLSVRSGVTAELRGMTITGGSSVIGAGILNAGALTLTNSVVLSNTASQSGGGISQGGVLTLMNSEVLNNTAGYGGGGIWASGVVTLTNSTVSGNTAESEDGGGIWGRANVTLTNSTVSNNTAGSRGGGIGLWCYGDPCVGGALTLTNSTVSNNTDAVGVGIATMGDVVLTSSTISGNDVLQWSIAGPTFEVAATLIDGECRAANVTSGGYNIESPGDTCGFDQTGDQSGVTEEQLNLGPLQDNGGPTMTHKPGGGDFGSGSVAIDRIPEVACVDADGQPLATDQRGEPRPVAIPGPEPRCDVGAFELQQ